MKKKEFKAELVVALTAEGVASPVEATVEGAVCKLGRKLRTDSGEVAWSAKDVPLAVGFYKEYGEKPEKVVAKKTAKKKLEPAKPLKKAAAKKSVVKKAQAKKKATPKKASK